MSDSPASMTDTQALAETVRDALISGDRIAGGNTAMFNRALAALDALVRDAGTPADTIARWAEGGFPPWGCHACRGGEYGPDGVPCWSCGGHSDEVPDPPAVARIRSVVDELVRELQAAEERADGMARAPYGEFQKAVDRARDAEARVKELVREHARREEALRLAAAFEGMFAIPVDPDHLQNRLRAALAALSSPPVASGGDDA